MVKWPLNIDRTVHDFQFTHHWFRNKNMETFRKFVLPAWRDEPICYLELGVFEGESMVWMLQHVLQHPGSFAVGVDPWLRTVKIDNDEMGSVMSRALHNTEPYRDRCQLVRGNSSEVLRMMVAERGYRRRGKPAVYAGIGIGAVDVCLVDGCHHSLGVLDDARLVSQLLKPGGWMIFDDTETARGPSAKHDWLLLPPKLDHVREGIDLFLLEPNCPVKLIHKHKYVEIYEKQQTAL